MRNIEIALQHGWGFDSHAWDNWFNLAEGDSEPARNFARKTDKFLSHLGNAQTMGIAKISLADRGYFNEPKEFLPFNSSQSIKILTTHSLGLHLVPNFVFSNLDLLVIISGFREFHPLQKAAALQSARIIKRMKQKLLNSAQEVLTEFYRNCYSAQGILTTIPPNIHPDNLQTINHQKLLSDLEFLDSNIFDLNQLSKVSQILLLHGSDDAIVSIEKSQELHKLLPNSKLHIAESQGHALPFTSPNWCLSKIAEALDVSTDLSTNIKVATGVF